MSVIQLSLAGQPQVLLDGRAQPLQAVDAALLSWLALQGPTARSRVAELLWPGSGEQARGTLRQRLYKLRHALGVELVVGQQTLALAPQVQHDLADAHTLLDGVVLDAGTEMAQWLSQERERRHLLRRQEWAQALQQAQTQSDASAALHIALQWLQAEPEHEAAHTSVIRQHYLLGDRAAALRAYQRCEQMLQRTLGVLPQPETQALRRMLDAPRAVPAVAGAGLPAALLRPPRLVGRQAETTAAHAGWAQGKVVALVAEAGMGKTRLLQHLAAQANDGTADGTVGGTVYAAARPGDAGVPLATLARLLRGLPTPPLALAPAQRGELARVLPEWQATAPAEGALGERLLLQRAVAALFDAQPGLQQVLLDDLHFADSASLQLLQALLDDPAGPLQWALGYRPAEASGPLHDLHDALLESARLHAVALAPLGPAALEELLADLALPGLTGPELAQALWQRTGGNPMFVLEALKHGYTEAGVGQSGGAAFAALAKPQSVARLIERRLAQLSPAALALARCAAIAGSDFSTPLAAQVMQTPAIALADAWAELEAAGVLREQAFAHDLVFEATLALVPKPIARHLHAEVAQQLQAAGGSAPATLARHWLAAGQLEQAVPQLQRAAEAASMAYDSKGAALLWEQLVDTLQAAGRVDEAYHAAARAAHLRYHSDVGSTVQPALQRLLQLARTPEQQAGAWQQHGEWCLSRGDLPQAQDSIARALAVLPASAPQALRLSVLNALGVVQRRLKQLAEAQATFEQAVQLARTADDAAEVLPALLNNLGLVLQQRDQHEPAITLLHEAAERQTDPVTRARVLNNAANSLAERGPVHLAYEQRLAAARLVAGSDSRAELMLALSLGINARHLGRLRDALTHLGRAAELSQSAPHHREQDLHQEYATIWLLLGRPNQARPAVERAVALVAGKPEASEVAVVQAKLALALHQPDVAAAHLVRAAEVLEQAGDSQQLRRVWVCQSGLLPPEQALALMHKALLLPGVVSNAAAALPLHVCSAQAWLRLGQPAPALRAAERAADWLSAVLPLGMTVAEVWLTLAQAAHAAQEPALARSAAARGLDWVAQVAQQLDEMHRDGWQRLNPVNAELAALAAQLRA